MRPLMPSVALAAALATIVASAAAAQQPTFNTHRQVTLVMKNGDRHNGTLVYHNDRNFNLIENGKETPYVIDNVAFVDFEGGNPPVSELNQLPRSSNPPEMRSHMLVLKDGTVVHGKFYTFKENSVTFDTQNRERRDFDLSNVRRLYVSAPGTRSLYAAELGSAATPTGAATTPPPAGAIQVQASRPWTDTGVTVRRGDRLVFSTTGQISIRNGGDMVGPEGSSSEDRAGAPVPSVPVGALIGRIGTGAPFAIGASSQPITMPGAGRLYLGVNDAGPSDNSGAFTVTVVR
jgi:hypothetical protein